MAFLTEPLRKGKDKAEAVFPVADVAQGGVVAQVMTVCRPAAKDLVSAPPMLGGVGLGSNMERSAQISNKAVLGSRCSSHHSLPCG